MYDTEQQIENIMNTPSMIPDEKRALYFDKYHRLLALKINIKTNFKTVFRISFQA